MSNIDAAMVDVKIVQLSRELASVTDPRERSRIVRELATLHRALNAAGL